MTEQDSRQGSITLDTMRKAIMGAHIANNPDLRASYGGIPEECSRAAEAIQNNLPEFDRLVHVRLEEQPMTKFFLGQLVARRLKQRGVLASPIMSALFDEHRSLELRLSRIRNIPGVNGLRKEYRGSSDPDKGDITDQVIVDLDAEVVVLDFLMQSGFTRIEKVTESENRAHVDILACQGGKVYAVEVTRKREIRGWETLDYGNLEDCEAPANRRRIRRRLISALLRKQGQLLRAIEAGTVDVNSVKVVAIKTSDYGFAECIDQACEIACQLLTEPNWPDVDCIWLLPNTNAQASCWVCRRPDSVPESFAVGSAEAAAGSLQHSS